MPRQSFWAGQGFELDIDGLLRRLGDPPILSIKKCAAKGVSRSPEGGQGDEGDTSWHTSDVQSWHLQVCNPDVQEER